MITLCMRNKRRAWCRSVQSFPGKDSFFFVKYLPLFYNPGFPAQPKRFPVCSFWKRGGNDATGNNNARGIVVEPWEISDRPVPWLAIVYKRVVDGTLNSSPWRRTIVLIGSGTAYSMGKACRKEKYFKWIVCRIGKIKQEATPNQVLSLASWTFQAY